MKCFCLLLIDGLILVADGCWVVSLFYCVDSLGLVSLKMAKKIVC